MNQKEVLKVLKMGKNVFLTGAAGSGKTYVLNEYIQFLRQLGVDVAVTASTGIAATHLRGVTIHSWSGIGIKDVLTDHDLDSMEQKVYLWKRFEKTKVLVIDEISMLSASTLDCVDRVCKFFKRSEEPFGGIQVIFSGDFFQLPPIEKKKQYEENTIFLDDEEESGKPFAFKSKSWKESDLKVCYLSEQYRQKDDEFTNLLSEIRDGEVSTKSIELLNKKIVKDIDQDITKLYTHNINVDSFNNKKLQEVKGEEKSYNIVTTGNTNLVEAIKRGSMISEKLTLKKGAIVMFTKNNPVEGYVNGTVGEIVGFKDSYPLVKDKDGNTFLASPQSWSIIEGEKTLAEISQVPLKLAWAVTIHKSQGMTLDRAYMDLSGSFVEGQGYVALSRVKSLKGLYLKGFNRMALEVHGEVLNINEKFKKQSEVISKQVNKLKSSGFKNKHQEFMKKIGAKKNKVLDDDGKKLSTYDITHKLLKEKKSLDKIVSERDLKIGTIISHIEKLLDEKEIKRGDILYLKPKTEEFDNLFEEVKEESKKMDEFKLTPVFKALGGKYSFEDIKFAKIFI